MEEECRQACGFPISIRDELFCRLDVCQRMEKIFNRETVKKYMAAIIMVVLMCGLAVTGRAKIMDQPEVAGVETISPVGHQPLRASVVSKRLSRYTIDIKNFANIVFNENAPTYAIYVESMLPSQCGDFSEVYVDYTKPSEHYRRFNLENHPEIAQSLKTYGCVVLKNAKAPLPEPDSVEESPSPG